MKSQNKQFLSKGKKKMLKKVLLITTPGCEACKIMENIIRKVHKDNLYTFSIDVQEFNKVPEFIKINVPMNDFPVTVLLQGGKSGQTIKYHFVGTKPAREVQSIINDLNFN